MGCTMLTRVILLVAFLVGACGPASEPTAQELATVVIVKSDLVFGDNGLELVTQPVCGGVAVGPRAFVTVDHCAGAVGTGLSYVDSQKWRTTSDFFEDGTVLSVENGIATVRSVRTLPGYVGTSAPSDGVATLVLLLDRDLATVPTRLDARHFDAAVDHGHSGFGLFQGELVGVVDTCDEPVPGNGTVCLESGGSFYGLLP